MEIREQQHLYIQRAKPLEFRYLVLQPRPLPTQDKLPSAFSPVWFYPNEPNGPAEMFYRRTHM